MATEIPIFQLATPAVIAEAVELVEGIRPDIDATVAWGLAAEAGTVAVGAAVGAAAGSATAAETARAAAVTAKTDAVAAKDAAVVAKNAAQAVPTTTAGLMDAVLADTSSAPSVRLSATIGTLSGSANSPHTSATAARNSAVTKNYWECPTIPDNWLPGDRWDRVDNS
jgi:hypothetical protein